MLHQYMRFLKYDGANFTDLSIQNQDESTINMAVLPTVSFYVGQYYPFNNIFYNMSVVNANAADISVQYWGGDGTGWVTALDILDGTKTGTVPLAKSGVIQFMPNKNYAWMVVDDTSETYAPTEMQTLRLYDLYWIKFSYSATLVPPVAVPPALTPPDPVAKAWTYSFTTSKQLNNIDVEINNFYTSFSAGKTNWDDEIVTASRIMVMDLRRMGLAQHYGQMLRFDDVSLACEYKTLWLIYSNLGKAYAEKAKWADDQYTKCMNIERFTIDKDKDGQADKDELYGSIKQLIR